MITDSKTRAQIFISNLNGEDLSKYGTEKDVQEVIDELDKMKFEYETIDREFLYYLVLEGDELRIETYDYLDGEPVLEEDIFVIFKTQDVDEVTEAYNKYVENYIKNL